MGMIEKNRVAILLLQLSDKGCGRGLLGRPVDGGGHQDGVTSWNVGGKSRSGSFGNVVRRSGV